MAEAQKKKLQFVNLNLGLLGHVDSGKTSLARALSDVLSTASLDKNPQSKARGISLDLGFSSFRVDLPEHLSEYADQGIEELQFTVVDCPGHASLMKTIVGGAQIIDLMLLVVDIQRGLQTQTAECLILAELLIDNLIVVFNKIDLLPKKTRAAGIEKAKKKLAKTLAKTKFKDPPMVAVCANKGGGDIGANREDTAFEYNIQELKDILIPRLHIPDRYHWNDRPFICAIDHCFPIKGKGTVMTGTVLQGSIKKGGSVYIPKLGVERKVKTIQMFHQPVPYARSGDRLAMAMAQVNSKEFERGFIGDQNALIRMDKAIAKVNKIKHFKKIISTGSKFHITVGHSTVLAKVTFFRSPRPKEMAEHGFLDKKVAKKLLNVFGDDFSLEREYLYRGELEQKCKVPQFCLLEFERPLIMPPDSLLIASKMDVDIHEKSCRLSFFGNIVQRLPIDFDYSTLKLYKPKCRTGHVDRVKDAYSVVATKMFGKGADLSAFVGMRVQLSTGQLGKIEGSFGKSGMFVIRLTKPLDLGGVAPKKFKLDSQVLLKFKKHVYHTDKRAMIQTEPQLHLLEEEL